MNRNVSISDDAALLQVNRSSPKKLNPIQYWYTCHLRAATSTFGEMITRPIANLFTILVIALAFALPTTLFVMLSNLTNISQQWHAAPQISLYIKKNTPAVELNTFINELRHNPSIEAVSYITPNQGLQSLNNSNNVRQAVSLLGANPLPGVIVVTPNHLSLTPARINTLFSSISQNTIVETGQMNQLWMKRLYYIIRVVKTVVISMAVLFSVGVILIVGNTIRLALQSQDNEIKVMRLVGATKSFIRRPLLYRGIFYGLGGTIIAWIVTAIIITILRHPADQLALTYNNVLTLQGLPFMHGLCMIVAGTLLSLIGARLAADHYLRSAD